MVQKILIAASCVAALAACGKTEAAAPAEAAKAVSQQFDLHCVGQSRDTYSPFEKRVSAYEETFLIDLAAGTWCREGCKRKGINPIQSIEPGRLVLTEANSSITHRLSINRMTGELWEVLETGASGQETNAKCEKRPFSGFPQAQF